MTQTEIRVIRNILARLKKPNCGCSNDMHLDKLVATANSHGVEVVSRIYLESWVIPALEMMLPESRNPQLAARVSRP